MDKKIWIVEYRFGTENPYHWSMLSICESETVARGYAETNHGNKKINWYQLGGSQFYIYARIKNFKGGYSSYRIHAECIYTAADLERWINRLNPMKSET